MSGAPGDGTPGTAKEMVMKALKVCKVRFCGMMLTKHPSLCTHHAAQAAATKVAK